MEELKVIMEKFAASGWELIAAPARGWKAAPTATRWWLRSARRTGSAAAAAVSWTRCIKERWPCWEPEHKS